LNSIARYDLAAKVITAQLQVEDSLYRGSESLFNTEYNYYDLAVDENGLWLVYAYKPLPRERAVRHTLLVAKLEPNYLEIEKTWNITVDRHAHSNSFIVDGVLYLVKSGTDPMTTISFAYDLYNYEELSINLPFANVFGDNKMVSYNPVSNLNKNPIGKDIMAWDNGKIVSYRIRKTGE